MANENQSQQNIQETAASLSAAQKNITNQYAATNKEFKESINLLNKINKLIDDSASKTQSFEKSTINIKRIQQERERILRKEANLQTQLSQISDKDQKKADNYIKKIEERKKAEEKILKARSLGLQVDTSILQKLEKQILGAEKKLTAEQLTAIAIKQSKKSLDDRVKLINEELEKEKQVKDSLGLTGIALKVLNKYLIFGKDTYSKMVEEAREGEKTTKQWVATAAILSAAVYGAYKGMKSFADVAKSGLDSLTGSGGPVSKFTSPFTNLIKQIPFIGGLLGGLADAFFNLVDFALGSSSAIQAFGRNLGLSAEEATKLNNRFSAISQASGNILFNSEKLRKSQTELSQALGLNAELSGRILLSNIELADIAGLDLETRKELALVSQVTGKDQIQLYKTLLGQNEVLKKNLGVNIRVQDAIKQAASLGGVLGLTFTKYPEKLTKSLMVVKSMGLELKQLDSIADSFLDFESSISKEFEAQLLTGKDINLMKAREAFLNNDLATAAAEITSQVGSSAEFLDMNRIKAESLASAFGMSRDQLGEMLKQQELFASLNVKDLKSYQQKVVEMNKTVEGQKELVRLLGEQEYSAVMSQTATEKIASFIDRIKQSFADLLNNSSFKDFIDKVINYLSKPEKIQSIINGLTDFVSKLISAFAYIVDTADIITNILTVGFKSIPNSIPDSLHEIAKSIGEQKISGLTNTPETVSVGSNVAASNSIRSQSTQDNMMMARPSQPQAVNVNINNKIVDNAADRQISYSKVGYVDKTTHVQT